MFDWITELMRQGGYLGIAALMFLENLFPPVPSELIMPSAGYAAGEGRMSLIGVVLAGTAGSLLGALFWYGVGSYLGTPLLKRFAARHGRWLTLSPAQVDKVDRWFDRHCAMAVFLGRLVPAVRTLISVPAGIFGMSLPRFLAYSALGTAIWSTALATAGYLLRSNYARVSDYLNPITNAVVVAIAAAYLYRVVTWHRASARQEGRR